MAFTQAQIMWIVVFVLVVILLGSFGYYFSTKLGIGGPTNPHSIPFVPARPYCLPCGIKGTVHQLGLSHDGFCPPYYLGDYAKPYITQYQDES